MDEAKIWEFPIHNNSTESCPLISEQTTQVRSSEERSEEGGEQEECLPDTAGGKEKGGKNTQTIKYSAQQVGGQPQLGI